MEKKIIIFFCKCDITNKKYVSQKLERKTIWMVKKMQKEIKNKRLKNEKKKWKKWHNKILNPRHGGCEA